jgi:hypothetical protein
MASLVVRFCAVPAISFAATCGPSLPEPVEVQLFEGVPAPSSTPETAAPAPSPGRIAVNKRPPATPSGSGEFDRAEAVASLARAAGAARGCQIAGGATDTARVRVMFAPSGDVTTASIEGGPFADTPVGECIVAAFRKARVPSFGGDPVIVVKSVTMP